MCFYMFSTYHLNLTWNVIWNSPETHLNLDAHVNWMYMHFKFNYIPITCISMLANHNLLALQCNQTHLNCMSMNNKNMSMNCICTQWISIEFQCMSMHVNCMSMTCNCMSMTWIARLCMSLHAIGIWLQCKRMSTRAPCMSIVFDALHLNFKSLQCMSVEFQSMCMCSIDMHPMYSIACQCMSMILNNAFSWCPYNVIILLLFLPFLLFSVCFCLSCCKFLNHFLIGLTILLFSKCFLSFCNFLYHLLIFLQFCCFLFVFIIMSFS